MTLCSDTQTSKVTHLRDGLDRNNSPRIGRVLVARGRDAADVAMTTTFGPNILQGFRVWADKMTGPEMSELPFPGRITEYPRWASGGLTPNGVPESAWLGQPSHATDPGSANWNIVRFRPSE